MFQAQRIRCLPFRSLQSRVTFLQNIRYWDANWELIMEEFERLGYKRSTTCIHHTDALKASPVEFSISYVSWAQWFGLTQHGSCWMKRGLAVCQGSRGDGWQAPGASEEARPSSAKQLPCWCLLRAWRRLHLGAHATGWRRLTQPASSLAQLSGLSSHHLWGRGWPWRLILKAVGQGSPPVCWAWCLFPHHCYRLPANPCSGI